MPPRGNFTLSPTLWGAIMVFIGAIGTSSKAILAKLAYVYGIDAISLLAIRMLMVFPIFAAIAWYAYRRLHPKPAAKYYFQLIPIGLLGYYLASFLDFQGLQYVPAAIERLILFTYPTLVVLLSRIILKTRINTRQWMALMLAYAGILIVLVGDLDVSTREGIWKGGIWIFMAALCYASYIIGSHRLIPIFGVAYFTSLAMSIASVGVFIHSYLKGAQDLFSYPQPVYEYIGIMGVVSTILPAFLISAGIKRIGPGNTAIIGSVGPVSTIVLAYLLLDEPFGGIQIVGTLAVMAGVLLISTKRGT